MKHQLLTRDQFRETVLARDKKCVCCEKPTSAKLDAHHLIERRLWDDAGYYAANGVSLCGEHHLMAEKTIISPQELRDRANISSILLPEHLDPGLKYDKWGNPYLNKDTRARGELFHDEPVQKILREAGVLGDFLTRSKYPKTMHLTYSPGLQNDDRLLHSTKGLEDEEVVVTLKLDGENFSGARNYSHARSLDSGNHPSRNWVKALHGQFQHELPDDFVICGENVFAEHSLRYENLPSYFFVFNIWDKGVRLAWDDMVGVCKMLNLEHVPILWRGKWDAAKIESICKSLNPETQEGAVIQVTRSIRAGEWKKTSAKFVRAGHVQTDSLWMLKPVTPNRLAKTPEEVSFLGKNVSKKEKPAAVKAEKEISF